MKKLGIKISLIALLVLLVLGLKYFKEFKGFLLLIRPSPLKVEKAEKSLPLKLPEDFEISVF